MSKVELKNATKYIINKKQKIGIAVIYNLSAVFQDHKINVVLGESGSGKTMLLKSIAGIENINSGKILFDNIDITDFPPQKRNVSYLSQNYALYPHLTVFENIAYPLVVAKINEDEIRRRVENILEMFDISVISTRKPKELSGGQIQRVALARAIIKRPDVLLLDEPLSNIDEQKRTVFLEEIKNLQKRLQLTIIYVTHQLREASFLADTITIIENGAVIESGDSKVLFSSKSSYLYKNFICQVEDKI